MLSNQRSKRSHQVHSDLVIISAGFDAHKGDPLGQLLLSDEDFVQMTSVVKEWAANACAGRVISCMEGGYNLDTLGETVRARARSRAHKRPRLIGRAQETLDNLVRIVARCSFDFSLLPWERTEKEQGSIRKPSPNPLPRNDITWRTKSDSRNALAETRCD